MELIDLKTNSSLKMKFDELSSAPIVSDMIHFYQSLPCRNVPQLGTFTQSSLYVVSEQHRDVNKYFKP